MAAWNVIAAAMTIWLVLLTPIAIGALEVENPGSIVVGSKVSDAKALLASQGIEMSVYVAAEKAVEGERKFIIRPLYKSSDALIMVAGAEGKDGEHLIKELSWQVQYQDDCNLPVTLRANRVLRLESVDLNVLLPNEKAKGVKRGRPKGNPFE